MMKKVTLIHLFFVFFLQLVLIAQVQAEIPADLLKSAENGNAGAQFTVARSYELGKRVKSDKVKAIKWYTKAANQGHTDAAYRLGLLYYKGLGGFKVDLKKAFHFISLAANKNHKNSQANLAKMYANGDGVERNEEQSDYWYEQAFTAKTQSFADYLKEQEKEKAQSVDTVVTKPVVKPRKVKQKRAAPKPALKPTATREKGINFPGTILENVWFQKNKPSIYLNSSVSSCKLKKSKIVCSSSRLRGSHSTGAYKYKVRSIISKGSSTKDLKIQYRKLYTSVPAETIEAYDDDDASSSGEQLVVGWEKKSHSIGCRFESAKAILCRPIGEDAFYIKRR